MNTSFMNMRSVLESSESSIDKFVNNKFYSSEYYEDALRFVTEMNTSITDEQIKYFIALSEGTAIEEATCILCKAKTTIAKVVDWIKGKSQCIKAKFSGKKSDSIKEAVVFMENVSLLSNIMKGSPISLELDDCVKDLREAYLESFIIQDNKETVSLIDQFDIQTESLVNHLDMIIHNEEGSVYGQTPYTSFDDLRNFVESVCIYFSSICEAVEENYNVIYENKYTRDKYKYSYSTALDFADTINLDKSLIPTIEKSILKLEKELNDMETYYESWKHMDEETKNRELTKDFIFNNSVNIIKGVTTKFIVGLSFAKIDKKLSVEEAEDNMLHNIKEVKRTIKYLKSKKTELTNKELKGGN